MSELTQAVLRMLEAFGAASAQRAEVFVEAVREQHLCERCAAAAARTLAHRARRRPVPAELCEQVRDTMATGVHAQHVPERAGLSPGEPEGFWRRVAPAIVRRAWPELGEEEVGWVCAELQRQAAEGIVEASEDGPLGVRAALGEPGDTERARWERLLAGRRRLQQMLREEEG